MYLCIVFFMVLDLRLIEDWVVVRQPFFFLNTLKKYSLINDKPLSLIN